jgi:head-tail adaptor
MSFNQKYSKGKSRIGRMNRRVKLFIPLSETTAMGGEKITYQEWIETWASVENVAGNSTEEFAADRDTAFNSKKFIIRFTHKKLFITV